MIVLGAGLCLGAEGGPVERAPWLRLLQGGSVSTVPCQVRWKQTPLNEATQRLREACGRVVWIDRRLDPTTPVTAEQQPGESLGNVLQRVAAALEAEATSVAGVVSLGPLREDLPTRVANRLEEVDRLPRRARRPYLARDAISWPRLTEPRQMIASLLKEKGVELHNGDLIPHDLWNAQRLPPAPLADQLTLLLAGFDLDWQIANQGRQVRLIRASTPTSISATHRLPQGVSLSTARIKADLGAGAEVAIERGRVILSGAIHQHAMLREMLSPTPTKHQETKPRRPLAAEEHRLSQRFTLRVSDQPAAQVLRALAKQVDLEAELDAETRSALTEAGLISFETKQATLDELLEAFARAANVSIERRGGTIVVDAAESPP